jgi:hypothetical protein
VAGRSTESLAVIRTRMGLLSRLFGSGKAKTTADHPLVIPRPMIGFLNLKGADGEKLMETDALVLAPLFSTVEKSTRSPPKCHVFFIYCDLDPAGKVLGSSQSVRDLIKSAGAYIAVVASENPPESYINAMKVRSAWSANVALALDRKSDKLAMFFRRLFDAMFGGQSMLLAWVALAPQIPGHDDPDAPGTIMAAEAGHVVFSK